MLNTVIVIDDSEVDRYIALRILKKSGITKHVIEMADAASALELIGDRACFDSKCGPWPPPVVILLDINMPQMGGFDFLEEVDRRIQRGEIGSDSFAVTMHTSSSDPGDIDRARRHAVVMDFLMKPLSVEAVSRIAELAAARSPEPSGGPA
jgi:CheY-like chemotaxis protein